MWKKRRRKTQKGKGKFSIGRGIISMRHPSHVQRVVEAWVEHHKKLPLQISITNTLFTSSANTLLHKLLLSDNDFT